MKLLTVKQTQERLSCGLTRVYELMGSGRLDALKLGGRTMITDESVERFIASLPRAVITTQRRRETLPPGKSRAGRPPKVQPTVQVVEPKQKPVVERERL